MLFEELELFARLYAIGGDANVQPAAHADHGGDGRRIGFGSGDASPSC
jgi:hypothetical protein